MGVVQLPDELQQVIERQVAEGRAASAVAFLEEAALRLIDDARLEDDEVRAAAEAGISDFEAGRYTTVTTSDDSQGLLEQMLARLHASLSAEE
jgi:Arc/MetJ-type ribon-helix-helix transcriptional regulator